MIGIFQNRSGRRSMYTFCNKTMHRQNYISTRYQRFDRCSLLRGTKGLIVVHYWEVTKNLIEVFIIREYQRPDRCSLLRGTKGLAGDYYCEIPKDWQVIITARYQRPDRCSLLRRLNWWKLLWYSDKSKESYYNIISRSW